MNVLLISYYFDPFPGVGAKRTSYWANHAYKFGIKIDVITGTVQDEINSRITFVPLSPSKRIIGKLIKDSGLGWTRDLKIYFDRLQYFEYDIVIFSGGPFMHFGVAKYLQKKYGCKTILDYRDPFGNNPRHQDGFLKKTIKTFFEKRFNRAADAITTVNDICKMDMSYSQKVTVIENGFDEQILNENIDNNTVSVKKGMLLNGGKLYSDFSFQPLLNVLIENDFLFFNQIGVQYDFIDRLKHSRIKSKGFVAYPKLLSAIQDAEICTVLTGGKAFETPTKLYDYIGMNKKILVITEGELYSGAIHSVLVDYPNVAWAKNDSDSILKALVQLNGIQSKNFNPYPFSRAASLVKLVNLMHEINT